MSYRPVYRDPGVDHGGYPLAANAKAILEHYQNRHACEGSGCYTQSYCTWRTQWLIECLSHMPPWGHDAVVSGR